MSTRRARIKAVAALPQRRKNADFAEAKKKQDQAKEVAENLMKSPEARLASVDKRPGSSPSRAALPSPKKTPRELRRTPDPEKVPLDWKVPTLVPTEKRCNTPIRIKTATWRPDVFVSPHLRASPLIRRSPVVKTPVIEVEIGPEKLITPHKRLLELQDGANKYSKVSESAESPKPQNDVPCSNNIVVKNIGYNSPSLPEISESDVMDGIVPLKPISNAPKPIDILKNEIISENAEVLFDPIVPLPSPTKVRQKLRPVPRLGPMRRNSVPGSASESEDESRRALHGGSSTPVPSRQRHDSHTSHSTMQSLPNRDVSRVRNDSVCSSISQIAPQTPAIGSPLKEKPVTKTRRQEVSRRMAAIRRRKESVQRDKLTMFDLIFYNPMTNPIVPDQDEIIAKEANKKEEEQQRKEEQKDETQQDTHKSVPDSAAPVPQIKLGPNGEIMLDEQSLVIKQSEQRKLSESVVREGAWMSSTGRVYRRTPRTADWSDAETVRFYRALAAIGTDFSLMVPLFPGRSRKELKLKFKKEERNNLAQIDKALRSVTGWDAHRLENEFAEERKRAEERSTIENERLKKEKQAEKERLNAMKTMVRRSKGSKALSTSIIPSPSSTYPSTADELIKAMNSKIARKKKPYKKEVIVIPDSPEKPKRTEDLSADKIREFATLTPFSKVLKPSPKLGTRTMPDMATLQKTMSPTKRPVAKSPVVLNAVTSVPADIAPGSLVVLTVDDPKAPSQKAIHTYIKQADGSIASVILDSSVMSSLVNYVKKDTPKAGSVTPGSVHSDRSSVAASPDKRRRKNSYTITDL